MNVFDIIGPVMIGPSSSHTAGAARLGKMARLVLGEQPKKAYIKLYGSFRETYKGHGTDRAIVAGLLGYNTDDYRLRESLEIAKNEGLECYFVMGDNDSFHPNTVSFDLYGASGKTVTMRGCSIGGGAIEVENINSYNVCLRGDYPVLVIANNDEAGHVAQVASVLAKYTVNVAQMRVSRQHKGGDAMMVIETDQVVADEVVNEISQYPGINDVFVLPALL